MGLFDGIAKLFGGALGGPLVSAGASLLGGALNNKQRNKELSMSDPAYIRQRAEAAGFNPLLFTNQAFQNSSNVPTFGSALADAGHFLGEGMLRNHELHGEQALRITELQQQNERLTELMRNTTLREPSRSIFENPEWDGDTWRPVNVFGPDGEKLSIPAGLADQFNIKPGHILSADFYQMVFGEVGENVQGMANMAQAPNIIAQGHYGSAELHPANPRASRYNTGSYDPVRAREPVENTLRPFWRQYN
jgi:hypothetical protein